MADISTVSGAVRKSPCPGSDCGGVMPTGVAGDESWQHYDNGELRCAYCGAFIPHDEKGRLRPHERPS